MAQKVVLHVEDDSDDAFFVARALRKALPQLLIRRVKDGREAIDYLGGTGEWAAPSNAAPDFVLLDLKLPDIDGFEVLQWIRKQPRLKELQVFILSGSSVAEDKERAQGLGAKAYFVKTTDYKEVVASYASVLQNPKASFSPCANGEVPDNPEADSTEGSQISS